MNRYLKEVTDLIITSLISFIIGGFVALPFILMNKYFESFTFLDVFLFLLKSMITGASIGFISRITFMFFYRNIRKNPFWAFFSIIFTIAAGTFLGAYIIGERKILFIILMIAIAEIIGLLLAYFIYKYSEKLNTHLEESKEKYLHNKDK